MHKLFPDHKLILGSQSPRRSQLLTEAGFHFEVFVPNIDEVFPENMIPENVPSFLAEQKASAIYDNKKLLANEILLTADSIVILDGKIYGKPEDKNDAMFILSQLSGKKHKVITGCCLMSKDKKLVFDDTSWVQMENLSLVEIEYYVETYKPYDKAGSYAVQEWIGLSKISKIEGTFSNIMGLPTSKLYENLQLFLS